MKLPTHYISEVIKIEKIHHLSRVDKHNYRKYDNDQDDIQIIRGTTSLCEDVKNLYITEFEESKIKYNEIQRETIKIDENYTYISENAKMIWLVKL